MLNSLMRRLSFWDNLRCNRSCGHHFLVTKSMAISGNKRKIEQIRWTTTRPTKRITDTETRFIWWAMLVVVLLLGLIFALKEHEYVVYWLFWWTE